VKKLNEPKYPYGKKVYIKKGFYRGYIGEIKEYEVITTKNQETSEEETYILYRLKLENVGLKILYEIREESIVPYKKYIFV